MKEQFNRACVMLYLTLQGVTGKLRNDESGMEVMQVVLLLGAGIVVILALMAFGQTIMNTTQGKVTEVTEAIGG